jgi:hypothetical protein
MYNYNDFKPKVFEEKNQEKFLNVRDKVHKTIKIAGCITMGEATSNVGGGDSWTLMAMVDRLVELGEIYEVKQAEEPLGQYRIFMKYN